MNRRVFGYDPYADPVRRKAMESARDANQAAISGKLKLVQETGQDAQSGFIMFLPIYKNDAPHTTLVERRANIVGWVSAPFRMGDLMPNLLSDHSALLDFEIYDGEEMSERTRMYDSDNNPGGRLGAQFQVIRQIMVADHVWTVAARSHAGFEGRADNDKARLIAYAGASASLLLAWLTWLLTSGRARAVKIAREMTRELSESKARYQQMFDETASIVFLLDLDSGRIVDANAAAAAFWGYSLDELRNMDITRINTSTPEEIREEMGKVRANTLHHLECRHRLKSGEIRDVEAYSSPLFWQGRTLLYSILHDVTERRQLKEDLEHSERKLRDIYDSVGDCIEIISADGRILDMNPIGYERMGYIREEMIGHFLSEFAVPEQVAHIADRMALMREQGNAVFESARRCKDGTVMPLEIRSRRIELDGQEVFLGISSDISERKRAELALQQALDFTEGIIKVIPDLIWIKDEDGVYLACNARFERFFGAKRKDIVGKTDYDFVDRTLADFFREHDRKAMAKDGPSVNEEWVTFADDGHRELLETVKTPVRDSSGKLIGVLGVARDISERKQLEQQLVEREELFRAIFEQAPNGVELIDPDTLCFVEVNPAACRMLGYSHDEYLQLRLVDTQADLNEEALLAAIRQVEGMSGTTFQNRHRCKNGDILNVEITTRLLNIPGKRLLVGVWRDITESKRAEVALRESENKYRELFEAAGDGIFIHDENGFLDCNEKGASMYGLTRAEIIGRHPSTLAPEKQPNGQLSANFAAKEIVAALGGTPQQFEWQALRADGTPLDVEITLGRIEFGGVVCLQAVVRDISARKQAENALRESEEKLRNLFSLSPLGIALTDMKGRYLEFNESFQRICGYTKEELNALDYWALTPRKYEADEARQLESLATTGRYGPYEKEYVRKDGTLIPLSLNGVLVTGRDGEKYIWSIVEDITESKRTEESLRITASVFDSSQEAILITDANNLITEVNPAFTQITSYSRSEVIGKNPKLLSSGRHDKAFYAEMWQTLKREKAWRGEVWNRRKSGEIYAELLSVSAICDADGRVQRHVAVFSDISHFKEYEAELNRIAHYDALTGIPNRMLLADRMKQAISQTGRAGDMMAVCYLDLDGFKPVNDTLGHEAGDQVLVEIAKRLSDTIRGGDTAARLGGDEFVVLLLGLERGEECVATLERLLAAIGQPIVVKGNEITMGASIGVSIYPLDDEEPDTLLRHADQAMYVAKQAGKNRFHIYDPALDQRARDQHEFLRSIRHGMEQGQLELHYQPKVNLRTRQMVGAEALIRWRHPERGLLLPVEFLRMTENTDLDIEIGEWVIATALAQIDCWHRAGLDIEVSINISAYHLESSGFAEKLRRQMERYPDLPPDRLQIEVLETVALNDIAIVRKIIEVCHKFGVSFALDDFGTGYSSLSYLNSLPVDALKIDQSFVRDMLEDKGDMAIVQGVIALARAFGRETVAEGIETDEHYQVLLEMGCELGQGYGIARPMLADELTNWRAG